MKAFISAKLTKSGLNKIAEYAQITLGGWGYTGKKLTPQELVVQAEDCDILIICYEEINEYVLKSLPKLKMIACSRGGVENIDKEAVKKFNLLVSSSPGRNANAVAELTIGLIICALRHIPQTHHLIMSHQWRSVPWDIAGNSAYKTFEGSELENKTLGLIGFGAIGRRVAKLALGFGVKVNIYDPYLQELPIDLDVEKVDFNQIFSDSDIVSLHCKLTPETKSMINVTTLGLMKKDGVLVNTSRGGLVDEEALYFALQKKNIACAALDVLESEPMQHNHPFLDLDNIILTPHIGGASRDIIGYQTKIILEDVISFFENGRVIHGIT